jgi:hypothetical protein
MAIGILVGFYFLIGYLERKKDADLLLQQLSLEQDKLKAAKQIAENEESLGLSSRSQSPGSLLHIQIIQFFPIPHLPQCWVMNLLK